jgi:hypothetical protein
MMNGISKALVLFSLAASISGCARFSPLRAALGNGTNGEVEVDSLIVKARGTMEVSSGASTSGVSALSENASIPISVVTTANTKVEFDTSEFKVPVLANDILNFGSIKISKLIDNDLAVCGAAGNVQCTKAVIRIYTTGTAGAGLWNAAGGYGAPISAGLSTARSTVGLGATSAAIVQTYTIDPKTHVLLLKDITPVPSYGVDIDFRNAGRGTYATTMIIEYGVQ